MLSDVAPITPELSPAQREAVTHSGGMLLVRGGGGTGKTTVVHQRFLWLADQGIRPEQIGVVTPSSGRADELRARLEGSLTDGYEQLFVLTPVELAALVVPTGAEFDSLDAVLSPGERFAMLLERIDELSLQRHDFAGSANALIAGFVRRIDRLKAHLIAPEDYTRWAVELQDFGAEPADAALEREFAEVYRAHERMLAEGGVTDAGNLILDALAASRTCCSMTATGSRPPRPHSCGGSGEPAWPRRAIRREAASPSRPPRS
jgi:DNA helicase-2/ATP-dependent DNA helicase PcrA